MNITFRIEKKLLDRARADLRRRHRFADERVGFFLAKAADLPSGGITLSVTGYHPVADDHYVRDNTVGAMMGSAAISKALEIAYRSQASMFHVHLHEHAGMPAFSRTDNRENAKFVPDFFKVVPKLPHGAVVWSIDRACGNCWLPSTRQPTTISDFVEVGAPLRWWPSRS